MIASVLKIGINVKWTLFLNNKTDYETQNTPAEGFSRQFGSMHSKFRVRNYCHSNLLGSPSFLVFPLPHLV